ncbi:MAG: APHP domain-containing protein, partial [Verrucomicrobiaceae bacterium]
PTFNAGTATYIGSRSSAADSPLAAGTHYVATKDFTLPQLAAGQYYLHLFADGSQEQGETDETNNVISVPITIAAPNLTVLDSVVPSSLTVGATVSLSYTVKNTGTVAAPGKWWDRIYLSADQTPGSGDINLAEIYIDEQTPLAANGTYSIERDVTIPNLPNGNYYVLFVTDHYDSQGETNPADNVRAVAVTVGAPDLQVTASTAPSAVVLGENVTVSYTVKNAGLGAATRNWYDRIYFSQDATFGAGDQLLSELLIEGQTPLAANAEYTTSQQFTVPNLPTGNGYLIIISDSFGEQPETEEGNNFRVVPISVSSPDLVVESVTGPASGLLGGSVNVSWTVRNAGSSAANATWADRVYLSRTPVITGDSLLLKTVSPANSGPHAANGTYTQTTSVELPLGLEYGEGDYYFIVQTDVGSVQVESNDSNNTLASTAVTALTYPPLPDLRVETVTAPQTAQPGRTLTVNWTVSNVGELAASGTWVDRIYLSTNGTLTGATLLASVPREGGLAQNGSYAGSKDILLPDVADGTYTILVVTDAASAVFEKGREANNTLLAANTTVVGRPDLVSSIVSAPANAVSGNVVTVQAKIRNNGSDTAFGAWVDRFYLSTSANGTGNDLLLAEVAATGPLGAGTEYVRNVNLLLPLEVSGEWFIVVRTDAAGDVNEFSNESNNLVSSALSIQLAPYADLAVSNVTAPALTIADPALITVGWTVTNQGTGEGRTSSWTDRVIASRDGVLGNGDDIVLASFTHDGFLAVGQSYSRNEQITTPPGLEGQFRLFVVSDATTTVFENFLETNNSAQSANVVSIAPKLYADLVVTSITAPVSGKSGQAVELTWTIKNQGIGITDIRTWADAVYLTTDPTGATGRQFLGLFSHSGVIGVDGTYTRTANVVLPNGISGDYYLVVEAAAPSDDFDSPYEFAYHGNNTSVSASVPVTLTVPPDLAVTNIVAPHAALSGAKIDVSWTVSNSGQGHATSVWVDRVFLQPVNGQGANIPLGSFIYSSGLQAGINYTRSEQFTLPSTLQGVYRVVVETNDTDSLYEHGATANNTVADDQSLVVSLAPKADLQVQTVTAPATVNGGGTLALSFVIRNQGTAPSIPGRWTDRVFLSVDNTLSQDDYLIGELENGSALAPGDTYQSETDSLVVPRRFRGPAFIIVVTDATERVDEFPNEGNNVFVQEINIIGIPPADLVTSNVLAPSQVFDGSSIEVRFKVTNSGIGETDRDGWNDTVWLTRDKTRPHPAAGDILLGSFGHSGSLAVGGSYEQVVNVNIPSGISGEWYIMPWSDAYDVVLEDTLTGNINPDDPNELDNNNYKARPITVLLREQPVIKHPDLVVSTVQAPANVAAGTAINVKWSVKNQGEIAAPGTWEDLVYLSNTPTLGPGSNATFLGRVPHNGTVDINGTYNGEASFLLSPAVTGQYIIVVTGNGVNEGSFGGNNLLATPTVVTNAPADLRVTSLTVPAENFSGESATIRWTVKNFGAAVWQGTRFWTDRVYISPDAEFIESRATKLGDFVYSSQQPLGAGESYTQSQQVNLPQGIGGQYYIHVITDVGGTLDQKDAENEKSRGYFGTNVFETPGNNLAGTSLPVTYREADLRVTGLVLPATTPVSGENMVVKYTVTNIGNRDTRQRAWVDRVFLSRDPSLDDGDQMIGAFDRTSILAAGDAYNAELEVSLPDGLSGTYYVIVFSDANIIGPLPPDGPGTENDRDTNGFFARVAEFQGEGNNLTVAPVTIQAALPADLKVTQITVDQQVTAGQFFDLGWLVTNNGVGATPARQTQWEDLIYISRDQFLDPNSDRYLGSVTHTGGLAAGASYEASAHLRVPRDLSGPFYIFVVTDPARYAPRGEVFEGNEVNNATATAQPVIINLPPPSDLQVDSITIPSTGRVNEKVTITWTGSNHADPVAAGTWTDAVYLSKDGVWDINDKPLGRATYTGSLAKGATYTLSLEAVLPPMEPGNYRIIVRPDIYNEIYEGPNDANNKTASAESMSVSVDSLQMGVPLNTTLSTGQERLYKINLAAGQTFRVLISTPNSQAANEVYIRHNAVPNGIEFDAAYEGALQANQVAFIPSTEAGTYYILVRGQSEPQANTPVTITAELVPFSITGVSPDIGGDSKYVTTTIRGAQFQPGAIVKLVRPGIAEIEPTRYEVVDGTKITAVFDFTNAPHGLYDVKVINPNGDTAILPYRYLVERAIDADVSVGLGGPRVIPAGQAGLYGFSLQSLTNVDTPYVYFNFGIPELGTNPSVFDFKRVVFSNNLRGEPEGGNAGNVPWASLDSTLNTNGELLAPGYAFDLAARGWVGRTFSVQTYPGLTELLSGSFNKLRDKIYDAYPEYRGKLENGPEDLNQIYPGLTDIYNSIQERNNPLAEVDDYEIAFRFHIMASATVLTRDEFIAQQTSHALNLREAILADTQAPITLVVLAANANQWTAAYLGALETAGYLRPTNEAPPIRENPLVVSLSNTLATGLLLGSGGEQIVTDGNLVDFFTAHLGT